ncbi:MAG TPA: CsbD family protein [Steroidobacteraceae bacterium]
MNQNQVDGVAKQVKGAIKEGASKVTGNTLGQVEGKVEKEVGKVQKDLGDAQERDRKDAPRP